MTLDGLFAWSCCICSFSRYFFLLLFFQPPRFDTVTKEQFEHFASLGRPFIVRSSVGNKDWSCEYLMERFPNVTGVLNLASALL